MSQLLRLQLQLIYTVATHNGALFSATPLLLNVIKQNFMKANRQANHFKSLAVSLVSVAQLQKTVLRIITIHSPEELPNI